MSEEHPNIALLKRLDLRDLAGAADLFADDFVWHYFNPLLPDLHGDHVGLSGLESFFAELGALTKGKFEVEPISVSAIGDELVVAHTRNKLSLDGSSIETDVVVVWRVVDGRFTEVWDIPSIHAAHLA